VISAKAPNKDDLKRIYLASKTAANGHTFLELAWVRIPQNTTSPSAHVAFEFNKATAASGSCGEPGGLVHRTLGDLLIVYDFEGGPGDEPILTLRRWVTSGACEVSNDTAPCWGPAVNLTTGGFAEAKVNTGTSVTDLLAPPALASTTGTSVSNTLNASEFGEAGIDLTAAGVFGAGTCESFGTAFGVSRSSGSSATAQMKDLVGPAPFALQNCGQIKIIKRTNPRGENQNFSFTSNIAGGQLACTADDTPASFTLNDDAGVDNAANTETCLNVPAGAYTVTEGADPTGFEFESLTCTAVGTGTSVTTSGKVASITMAGGGSVECIYVNKLQQGAILVTKTRKHAADGPGDHPHAGVSFTVNGVTKVTDANGQACFDGLTFNTYTVTETVPAGYVSDDASKDVVVDNTATCADVPYGGESVSFHNTPLTNLTVSVDSQVDGGTASTIACVDESDPPNTVASGSTNANGDGSATASDLMPGTYTCTVVIDP
jgi:Prealbumin-like fold domain